MKFPTRSSFFKLPGAAVFAVLLLAGRLSAAPATPAPKPGAAQRAPAPRAATLPRTNLTSAATVSSTSPSSDEDIRDIRQPKHLPTPWVWVAVAAGVLALAAGALAGWTWLRRGRFLVMTPQERALEALDDARRLMNPDNARAYCFAASSIIRRYIEERFQVLAPRLTTEEFLRDRVETRADMLGAHRALLGDFLQHCDLAKFAGWHYSVPALEEMHESAVDFVQQTAAQRAAPPREAAPQAERGAAQSA
jgi:hypothetical protein